MSVVEDLCKSKLCARIVVKKKDVEKKKENIKARMLDQLALKVSWA